LTFRFPALPVWALAASCLLALPAARATEATTPGTPPAPATEPAAPAATSSAWPAAPAPTAAPAQKKDSQKADPLGQLMQSLDAPAPDDAPATTTATAAAALPAAAAPNDVWERIRRGFAMPDLETKLAAQRTQWYAGQTDYMARMASRASLYLFHIVEEIEKRGMPTELALLPFVESAMQPEAESHAKAAGLWQFIPSTGRIYSLEQNLWRDERRDVIGSTRAALDYLQKLHAQFGDWHLALAAYNWGEGAVARAQARNRAAGRPTGYLHLRMPTETQHYVPKLQALKNIVRDPQRYGIALPLIRNEPYFVTLTKTRDVDVTTAARLAEMGQDEFRALNPSFNRPLIVGAAQHSILLPADRAETFLANLAAFESTGQPLASWTTYTLAPNETLAQVAARAGVSEASLREANRILPRFRLAPGSTILIPRDDSMVDDVAPEKLQAAFGLVPENAQLRQVNVRVRRGDTLAGIARRWAVQPEEIVAWNRLRSHSLFAGQRLTLTVARAPARPATQKTAQAASPSGQGARPAGGSAASTAAASAAARSVARAPVAR
jgi:membrane-bound lytic murein transglycosylase D